MFNEKLLNKGKLLDKLLRILFKPKIDDFENLLNINPQKILIVESHLIGDLVMISPLLQALRNKFPRADLHLFGNLWAKELFKNNNNISKIITVNIPWSTYNYSGGNLFNLFNIIRLLRFEKYDLGIDPRGDMRNNMLLWLINAKRRLGYDISGGSYFLTDIAPYCKENIHLIKHKYGVLSPLGISGNIIYPKLAVSINSILECSAIFKSGIIYEGPIVAVHPGASRSERRWSVANHVKLIRKLNEEKINVILVGGVSDSVLIKSIKDIVGTSCLIFQSNLESLMCLLNNVDVLVAMDSGAAHIGPAVGCPTVVLFGSSNPAISHPWGENIRIITSDCKKSGMDGVRVEPVFDAINNFLGK